MLPMKSVVPERHGFYGIRLHNQETVYQYNDSYQLYLIFNLKKGLKNKYCICPRVKIGALMAQAP
jgi:hypothetical protein